MLTKDASVYRVIWYGSYHGGDLSTGTTAVDFRIRVFEDNGSGAPVLIPVFEQLGSAAVEDSGVVFQGRIIYLFSADLSSPFVGTGATTYYISILEADSSNTGTWRWANSTVTVSDSAWFRNSEGASWTNHSAGGGQRANVAVQLLDCGAVEPPVPPEVEAGPNRVVDEGTLLNIVASFTDPNESETHTAVIDWGDESATAGTVDQDLHTVSASHTYLDEGVFTATVTVTDSRGFSGFDTFDVMVNNVPAAVDAGPDRSLIGRPQRITGEFPVLDLVASFADPGVLDTHTAFIFWGDGTSDPGVVNESEGSGTVSGSHVYRRTGRFVVTVRVTDNDGATGRDSFEVTASPRVSASARGGTGPTPGIGSPVLVTDYYVSITLAALGVPNTQVTNSEFGAMTAEELSQFEVIVLGYGQDVSGLGTTFHEVIGRAFVSTHDAFGHCGEEEVDPNRGPCRLILNLVGWASEGGGVGLVTFRVTPSALPSEWGLSTQGGTHGDDTDILAEFEDPFPIYVGLSDAPCGTFNSVNWWPRLP